MEKKTLKNSYKNAIVTGCAGFIGSNLVDRLLQKGDKVIGIDNFSTGQTQFLKNAKKNNNFKLKKANLLDLKNLKKIFSNCSIVYHLAANADVRFGVDHPNKDLRQNTIVTHNVLEAMRANDIKNIVYTSTGSIYGETKTIPTPEDVSFPIQTSFYGASKLAAEGLVNAYCESYGFKSWIFRFVSILGERYTHGHVFDFLKKLQKDTTKLEVLGNGKQRKSYLYIQDCIDAIFIALEKQNNNINIFNLGTNDYCDVNSSINWICEELNLNPKIIYTGGNKGWIGDNPFIFLDTNKINQLGWKPKLSIKEGIIKTVKYLNDNKWVFKKRK